MASSDNRLLNILRNWGSLPEEVKTAMSLLIDATTQS